MRLICKKMQVKFFFAYNRYKGVSFLKEYLKSVDDVLKDVDSTENGISSKEAEKRLEQNGKNKLKEPKKDGIVKKFIKSLIDPMIIMLLAAARNFFSYIYNSK